MNGFHRYHPENHDYGYIEYFRKSMLNDMDPFTKECMAKLIKVHEGRRDYFTESLRQIDHLIQIDEKPNVQLTEPEWELYKISISFQPICKLYIMYFIDNQSTTAKIRIDIINFSKPYRFNVRRNWSPSIVSKCSREHKHGSFL